MLSKPSANGATSTVSELKIKTIAFGGEKKGDKSDTDFKVVTIFCHIKLEVTAAGEFTACAIQCDRTLATRQMNT